MEEIIKKLDAGEVKTLMELMKLSAARGEGSGLAHSQPMKLDLPSVDLKLDGPATYLSWSRRIEAALVGKKLEGYLTGVKAEPAGESVEHEEWRITHALLYTWLLNSMVPKVASSVDGIRKVQDIWAKLKRTYAGAENHMRVFQIQRDIEAVVQGDRSIQEYSMELEQLWQDLDHFSPMSSCTDPGCKSRKFNAQMRTMQFLAHLNPVFDQRRSVLLAQTKIPSLDEAVSAMIQEESRIRLHSEPSGPTGARSALATLTSGMTGAQGETRRCYNCGEVGHLSKTCPKPPKEREAGGRGQTGGRSRGRGGRRGGRSGGYRAHLMVDPQEEEETGFTEEEHELFEMLKRKQKMVGDGGKRGMTNETSTSDTRGNFVASSAYPVTGDLQGEEDGPETWDWHVA